MVRRSAGLIALFGVATVASTSAVKAETLQEAIDFTLQSNPAYRIEVIERRVRDAEVRKAKAGYFPTVDLGGGYGEEETSVGDQGLNSNSVDLTRKEANLFARQLLFDGFATPKEVKRFRARQTAQAYGVHGSAEQTAQDAIEVYLEVLRQEGILGINERSLEVHQRIFDQVNLRAEQGVGRRADLTQIESRLALSKSNVVTSENNLRDAITDYLRVVGRLPGELAQPSGVESALPGSMDEAVSRAVSNNPILKAATADVVQREAQYEVAAAPYYPRFDAEFEWNWTEDADGEVGEDEERLLMLRARWNLYRGGFDKARREETAQELVQSMEQRNLTHRQVVESVRLSWIQYQAVLENIQNLEDHVSSAIETRDAYGQQFTLGQRTLLDVLDSEVEVLEAERDLLTAKVDGLFAQYRILVGTGDLFDTLAMALPEEAMVEFETDE